MCVTFFFCEEVVVFNELLNGITYWLSIGKVTALKKVKIPNKELNFWISVSVSSPMRVWNAKLLYEFYRVIISVTVEVFTTAAANRKLLKICFLPSADPWVGPCPKKSELWLNKHGWKIVQSVRYQAFRFG